MEIYTIGFSKKNLREFIRRIQSAGVKRVLDIRLNNTSQLAGYSKKDDLEYILELVNIQYQHLPAIAPPEELMKSFKGGEITWKQYEEIYNKMLAENNPGDLFSQWKGDKICLLCSEDSPKYCHRRLLAEYLGKHFDGSLVQHL